MKRITVLIYLWITSLLIAGCAVPLGEDYIITRNEHPSVMYITDYNLQTYVPIPDTGERPVLQVNTRGDLEVSVRWKDAGGVEIPSPFEVFLADTAYTAEIKLTAKEGYGFYPAMCFSYPKGKVMFQNDDMDELTRTVMVSYNNSDDADITFITDYNLQNYVPIPQAGDQPVWSVTNRGDLKVTVDWEEGDPASSAFVPVPVSDTYTFKIGAIYRAAIQLRTNPGYRFMDGMNFTYFEGTVSTQQGTDRLPEERDLTVIYNATKRPAIVNDLNLTPYISKPLTGAMPLTSFAGGQYMGTIIWKEAGTQAVLNGPFQRGMVYNAEVSLTPMMGYSFTGVRQNTFIHTGAETITNPADRGMVHIGFSATSNAGALVVYDTNLSGRIPQPAAGVTPLSGIAGTQYAGTISWDPSPYNTFQAEVAYTAVLTLIAVPGYTFTGVGENAFHHTGAKTITNPADSGSVTIRFPPAPSSINPVKSFGPVEKEGSALKLIKERKDDVYPLIIDLPPGYEEIETGVLLSAGANNIIINGQNRVLKIKNPGAFITVGAGVTLTLWNIRFEGHGSNNSPLFKVRPGGKLVLENGAVLVGNQSAGDVGGVWVNGGSLSLYNGAVIQKMRGQRGGGVLIDTGGQFAMNGGTIGGELAADGNIVSSEHGGGGVLVAVGSFDMNGGKIQYNTALAANSGGGVLISEKGTFNMYDGAIKENTAAFSNGDYNNLIFSTGGGVHVDRGIFTMDGVDALIEGNRSETHNSGGAVYNNGTFIMNNGIIRKNIGPSFYAGGGVHTDANFTMNNGIIQGNTVQSNYSGGGVFVRYSGTFIMNGGTIKGNIAENNANYSGGGVFLRDGGTFLMNGGTIGGKNQGDANIASGPDGFANGVYGIPGNFIMAGGIITGNTAASNNTGVCIGGEFTMKGSAQVAKDNIVLLKDNSKITIGGTLQVSPAANIKCAITPKAGTYLLKANSSALISGNYTKFLYNGQENHINGTPYQADSLWYGQYK